MKETKRDVPFPRSYWVLPGKLLAGAYRGSEDPDEAGRKLKGLIDCGVRGRGGRQC